MANDPLCSFALWFSLLVANELEEARLLGHQSRETSWTDKMLLELKKLRDPRIIAATSNERVTGGDMDWWFVGPHTAFCLTVQAKILHYRQHNPALWHYEDIAHPSANPGLQSRTLVAHARRSSRAGTPRYPYYLFYNPSSVPALPHSPWTPALNGVTVADGYVIANHIAAHVVPRGPFPITEKRFAAVSPMAVTLHELLCSGSTGIPTLEDIVQGIDAIWRRLRAADSFSRDYRRLRPATTQVVPREITRMIEARGHRDAFDDRDYGLSRDTVVFLSDE